MLQPNPPLDQPPAFEGRQFFGTHRAAIYLGISMATLKYHLYKKPPNLIADAFVGAADHTLIFSRATLDAFKARKRGQPSQAS